MLKVVWETVSGELSFDAVAGPAHSGALRVATLDHKTIDDTMEDQSIVKPFLNQRDKILYCVWCDIRIQFNFDHAAIFHFDGHEGIFFHTIASSNHSSSILVTVY